MPIIGTAYLYIFYAVCILRSCISRTLHKHKIALKCCKNIDAKSMLLNDYLANKYLKVHLLY